MNPQLKSLLTTALTTIFGAVATWLISKGLITNDQAPQLVNMLIGLAFAGGAAFVAWIKSREHTPDNQVLAAKTVPGVEIKVDTTAAPQKVVDLANDPFVTKVNPL